MPNAGVVESSKQFTLITLSSPIVWIAQFEQISYYRGVHPRQSNLNLGCIIRIVLYGISIPEDIQEIRQGTLGQVSPMIQGKPTIQGFHSRILERYTGWETRTTQFGFPNPNVVFIAQFRNPEQWVPHHTCNLTIQGCTPRIVQRKSTVYTSDSKSNVRVEIS